MARSGGARTQFTGAGSRRRPVVRPAGDEGEDEHDGEGDRVGGELLGGEKPGEVRDETQGGDKPECHEACEGGTVEFGRDGEGRP